MAAATHPTPSAPTAYPHPLVLLLLSGSAGLANVHIASWIQQRVDPTVRGIE